VGLIECQNGIQTSLRSSDILVFLNTFVVTRLGTRKLLRNFASHHAESSDIKRGFTLNQILREIESIYKFKELAPVDKSMIEQPYA